MSARGIKIARAGTKVSVAPSAAVAKTTVTRTQKEKTGSSTSKAPRASALAAGNEGLRKLSTSRRPVKKATKSMRPTVSAGKKTPQALPSAVAANFPGMKATRKGDFYDSAATFGDPAPSFRKGDVFIAMPFSGPEMEDVYRALREECERLGLSPERVDENDAASLIILDIVESIKKAQFIVFDLTYERPNVYYELGFAHGVGNTKTNVILIARKGTKIHFDIAALRIHFYDSTKHLRAIVRRILEKKVEGEKPTVNKERKRQKAKKKRKS